MNPAIQNLENRLLSTTVCLLPSHQWQIILQNLAHTLVKPLLTQNSLVLMASHEDKGHQLNNIQL